MHPSDGSAYRRKRGLSGQGPTPKTKEEREIIEAKMAAFDAQAKESEHQGKIREKQGCLNLIKEEEFVAAGAEIISEQSYKILLTSAQGKDLLGVLQGARAAKKDYYTPQPFYVIFCGKEIEVSDNYFTQDGKKRALPSWGDSKIFW